ncbi:MAG: Rv3212 family protein [Pseudonocardiaceae bacterium]
MPAPERRSRWDWIAGSLLVVAVVVVAATLWWHSDARHTTVSTAIEPPAEQVGGGERLPSAVAEIWRAPSSATSLPLVEGGTVVTAAAGEVAGRELGSGSIRWSYQRDLALCTVGAALHRVVALYQRGETCSEVSTLNWADGTRGPQRTGPVEVPTRLTADGDFAAATGQRYLEVWRPDLVRTLAYGRLPTPVQPGKQPRPDCTHGSLALNSSVGSGGVESGEAVPGEAVESGPRLALVEHCPDENQVRLTVQRAQPKESDQPEMDFSTLLPGAVARIVALSPDRVAVALPGPPRLLVFDARGNQVAEHPLAIPDTDLHGDPPGGLSVTTHTPIGVFWFTGSATVALDVGELRPRWTRPGSLGAGSMVAGRLLLPVPEALAVLDIASGEQIARLPVDRGGYVGPVSTASAGAFVLEQRGDTLVALG